MNNALKEESIKKFENCFENSKNFYSKQIKPKS